MILLSLVSFKLVNFQQFFALYNDMAFIGRMTGLLNCVAEKRLEMLN